MKRNMRNPRRVPVANFTYGEDLWAGIAISCTGLWAFIISKFLLNAFIEDPTTYSSRFMTVVSIGLPLLILLVSIFLIGIGVLGAGLGIEGYFKAKKAGRRLVSSLPEQADPRVVVAWILFLLAGGSLGWAIGGLFTGYGFPALFFSIGFILVSNGAFLMADASKDDNQAKKPLAKPAVNGLPVGMRNRPGHQSVAQ